MNKIDKDYTNLLQDILDSGVKKETRNGSTISVFGRQIRHKMSDGFPLLTTKKMYMKGIITELIWFLRGDTNIKYLVDNGCNIWNGDAFKSYLFNSEWLPIANTNRGFIGTKANSDEIMTQEKFINKCKTDTEFSEKWGLKIEERELGLEERHQISLIRIGHDGVADRDNMTWHETYNKTGIPTKLITITYNGTKIEIYE